MVKIILYIALFGTGSVALVRPWIGVAAAYLFVILDPQSIWFWHFEGLRPVYFVLVPTIIGVVIALLQGRLDLRILKNKRNLFLVTLWLCYIISYFFGSYIDTSVTVGLRNPNWVFSLVNKSFILYFIGNVCINSEGKLKCLALVISISVVYLTYWANAQYLFEGRYGRIGGPGGNYADENIFAMLFVTGLPFLYYLGYYFKRKILRLGIWLIIPFGWHAIFLTGSRGGLVGIVSVLLIIALRSPKKIIGLLIIPIFLIAYMWQAGDVMKNRSQTILEYREESSAASRLDAWDAAFKMITNHPITGVGLASFVRAFPDHSDKQPREAHNTFLQITAEAGILAGLMYCFIIFSSMIEIWKRSKKLKAFDDKYRNRFLFLLNDAIFASILGYSVCSLFLSLHVYEIFYFLCLLANSLAFLSNKITQEQKNNTREHA